MSPGSPFVPKGCYFPSPLEGNPLTDVKGKPLGEFLDVAKRESPTAVKQQLTGVESYIHLAFEKRCYCPLALARYSCRGATAGRTH